MSTASFGRSSAAVWVAIFLALRRQGSSLPTSSEGTHVDCNAPQCMCRYMSQNVSQGSTEGSTGLRRLYVRFLAPQSDRARAVLEDFGSFWQAEPDPTERRRLLLSVFA